MIVYGYIYWFIQEQIRIFTKILCGFNPAWIFPMGPQCEAAKIQYQWHTVIIIFDRA